MQLFNQKNSLNRAVKSFRAKQQRLAEQFGLEVQAEVEVNPAQGLVRLTRDGVIVMKIGRASCRERV